MGWNKCKFSYTAVCLNGEGGGGQHVACRFNVSLLCRLSVKIVDLCRLSVNLGCFLTLVGIFSSFCR